MSIYIVYEAKYNISNLGINENNDIKLFKKEEDAKKEIEKRKFKYKNNYIFKEKDSNEKHFYMINKNNKNEILSIILEKENIEQEIKTTSIYMIYDLIHNSINLIQTIQDIKKRASFYFIEPGRIENIKFYINEKDARNEMKERKKVCGGGDYIFRRKYSDKNNYVFTLYNEGIEEHDHYFISKMVKIKIEE